MNTTFLSRLDFHAGNFRDMIACCDVDLEKLVLGRAGLTLEEAAHACVCCRHGEACRRWLDALERGAAKRPPSFCPNAGRFRGARHH